MESSNYLFAEQEIPVKNVGNEEGHFELQRGVSSKNFPKEFFQDSSTLALFNKVTYSHLLNQEMYEMMICFLLLILGIYNGRGSFRINISE